MKMLIVAATKEEVQPFLDCRIHETPFVDFLITGAGMVASTYSLTKKISETSYDILLNVGIAGTFHKHIPLGSLVRVEEDCFCELGAEDGDDFLTLKELTLGESTFKEAPGILGDFSSVKNLPSFNGVTVNTVHGNELSIGKLKKKFSPDVESMEGATVFYVAQQEKILSLQIRSISNFIEKRNRSQWEIRLAIQNLNRWLIDFVEEFLSLRKEP